MRIKIDGSDGELKVVDAETGEELENVSSVRWISEDQGPANAIMVLRDVDITAEVDVRGEYKPKRVFIGGGDAPVGQNWRYAPVPKSLEGWTGLTGYIVFPLRFSATMYAEWAKASTPEEGQFDPENFHRALRQLDAIGAEARLDRDGNPLNIDAWRDAYPRFMLEELHWLKATAEEFLAPFLARGRLL